MEDSFFGFDSSVPLDDEGGGGRIAEPSEEEYDALNDETFGSAINSDWEEVHENLVRLRDNFNGNSLRRNTPSEYGAKHLFLSNVATDVSTPASSNFRVRRGDPNADSDLELNLSDMKLDDVDLCFDDSENLGGAGRMDITLDSSVWASQPLKPINHAPIEAMKYRGPLFSSSLNTGAGGDRKTLDSTNPSDFLREHFPSPFQHQRMKQEVDSGTHLGFGLPQYPHNPNAPKICTLEDIERNLITQQTKEKHQKQQQLLNNILKQGTKMAGPMPDQQQQHLQKQQQSQQVHQQKGPPGFLNTHVTQRSATNFATNLGQHPLSNMMQQQQQTTATGGRLPPGFPLYPPGLGPHLQQQAHPQLPPHPLLNQSGLPPNFPHTHQRSLPTPHLPIALNNFAMHPNFNAMRAAVAAGIHPVALVPPPQQPPRLASHAPNPSAILNPQQPNSMFNMFNMRLVQEIQQNHPLLQNAARQAHQQQHLQQNVNSTHQLHYQLQQRNSVTKQNHHRRDGGSSNGNLPPEEFDEYANLMSIRDKHWLIGIQLSQLNTDTPYIDDYYYTVHQERKAVLNGNPRHSQAHKDNQLNHPLTQPKGHAQLILVQLGNKNGTRNGQHREHRNSETGGGNNSSIHDQKTPYVFTPLKFENSLGKLQYGSVTAPRKIIDADIMNGDGASATAGENTCNPNSGSPGTLMQPKCAAAASAMYPSANVGGGAMGDVTTAQRKSRHILLHIETLYRIVLKLEDLDNPNAIATIIIKKKKESERIAALEQLENANKTLKERAAETAGQQTMNQALKNKFAYEIETKEALVAKLIAALTHDKIVAVMNVRKGKALIHRIMPYIGDNEVCWNVWIGVFSSLQNVVKKDREDAEGMLYALYPDFKKQIKQANFRTIVTISNAIPLSDKKASGIFCSRFGISSLVCLILQTEQIYLTDCDVTLNDGNKESWRKFLDQVATSLNRTIQNQTICAAIESDSIQPLMNHFARFKDLKLDSLLALITEAKQQIN